MKKQELLKIMDTKLLEKLFGFCYARTNDSWEAKELCSDIVFELVNAANTEGDIQEPYRFLWRIARNVYYDFMNKKRRNSEMAYQGDPEDIFPLLADGDDGDNGEDSETLLDAVYCQIAFLTRAYREVMVMFYLDGLSVAEIARRQNTSEPAIRQRLFAARRKIQNEVEEMKGISPKPVILDTKDYQIYGTGTPSWGDPRKVCTKQFSRHLVWLCRKRSITPAEAAEQLHVPAVYVEEELEALRQGVNGQYGLLRRIDNGRSAMGKNSMGRYAINFILLDREEVGQLRGAYMEQMPAFRRIVSDYVESHKEEYLAFPYLNRDRDWNLILWQQAHMMPSVFARCVERFLSERYFAQVEKVDRPFSVYGYVEDGRDFGVGCDCITATDEAYGYSWYVENIYNKWIEKHFYCWYHLDDDEELLLALRALDGLSLDSLSEAEKEHAARAIECGYLYREGGMLYTKILVCSHKDRKRLFHITEGLAGGCLEECAEAVAKKLNRLIRRFVPEHLLGEWRHANDLAHLPVMNALIEPWVESGILTPPENGIGAEGCWMTVEKH